MMFAQRRRRASAAGAQAGAAAWLVTHGPDIRYLCGFTGSNGALVLYGGGATLFTDGRYETQAQRELERAKLVVVAGKPVVAAACEWMLAAGVASCGFDPAHTSVAGLAAIEALLPRGLARAGAGRAGAGRARAGWFVSLPDALAQLREVKDVDEQDAMREAAALGVRLFHEVLEHVVPGAPEMEVALALEYMARLAGAERMSFDTIVAGGERSALPHGRASNAKLPRRGFVVLDFGVVLNGYCSDMTRTLYLGRARREERAAYEAVLEAQAAALAAVRAGVAAGAVDEAARSLLHTAGLGERFVHSTGHGVGLEIHEGPRLGKGQAQPLKAGMVITIEPGVYLPGRFGIRIEDTVLVTRTGCENLTADATKALMEL